MVIQLTKTKSITIGGSGKSGAGQNRKSADVVGIDMFGGDSRGFPAVRLTAKRGQIRVTACGFVTEPEKPLPASWEEAAKNPTWALPSEFQSPHAAFAVTSPDTFLVQTTVEAVKSDIANGAHRGEEPSSAAKTHKFGIRREPKKPEETAEPANAESKPTPTEIVPGVPVSNGGTRFVMRSMSLSDDLVMEAGMPEYQALWLSRLLPEGKRPTVASIQPRAAALTASILKDPEFLKADGNGLALFIDDNSCIIAGFRNRDLVLWRRCQGAAGGKGIREALRSGLGVDDEMLDSIMNDNLIDPRPVLEPIVLPIADELAVSRDYLAAKLGITIDATFIAGLTSGIGYWSAIFEDRARIRLIGCQPFDGFDGTLPDQKDRGAFTAAIGAALAYMAEGEE